MPIVRVVACALLLLLLAQCVAAQTSQPSQRSQHRAASVLGQTDRLTLAWRELPAGDGAVSRALRAVAASGRTQGGGLLATVELLDALRGTSGVFSVRRSDAGPAKSPHAICAIECADATRAEAVRDALHKLLTVLHPSATIRKHRRQQLDVETIPFGQTAIEVSWTTSANWVFAATDAAALREIAATSAATSRPSSNESATHLSGALPAHPGIGMFVDIEFVAELLDHVLATAVPREQVAEVAGVFRGLSTSLRAISVRVESHEPQPTRVHAELVLAKKCALTRAARELRPLTVDDVRFIPSDVHWAQVWRLDLNRAMQLALESLSEGNSNAVAMVSTLDASASLALGFSPLNQLLPALGDTWAIYDRFTAGGLLGAGTVAVVTLRDEDAIRHMLPRIVEVLTPIAQSRGMALSLLRRKVEGNELSTVVLGGLPMPIAPSWAIVDGRLIIGLLPNAVLATTNQMVPGTRAMSIVDRQNFAKRFADLGNQPLTFGYTNSMQWRQFSGSVRTHYVTSLLSRYSTTSQPLDPLSDVTLQTALTLAHDRYAAWRLEKTDGDDDIQRLVYTSIGDCDGFVDAAIAGIWLTTVAIPLLDATQPNAVATDAERVLRRIGDSLARYAAENDGKFPADLTNSAGGTSATYVAGQTWADDDRNVVAYIAPVGNGDETGPVCILRLDGSVAKIPHAELRRELDSTSKRLKRRATPK